MQTAAKPLTWIQDSLPGGTEGAGPGRAAWGRAGLARGRGRGAACETVLWPVQPRPRPVGDRTVKCGGSQARHHRCARDGCTGGAETGPRDAGSGSEASCTGPRSRRARPVSCQQKHPSVCGRHAARFGRRTGSGGAGAPGVTGLRAPGPWSHALSGQWTGLLEGTAGSRAGRAWKSLERRPAGREREGKEQRQDHGGHRGTGLQPTEAGQSRSGRIGSQLWRTSPSTNPHARQ